MATWAGGRPACQIEFVIQTLPASHPEPVGDFANRQGGFPPAAALPSPTSAGAFWDAFRGRLRSTAPVSIRPGLSAPPWPRRSRGVTGPSGARPIVPPCAPVTLPGIPRCLKTSPAGAASTPAHPTLPGAAAPGAARIPRARQAYPPQFRVRPAAGPPAAIRADAPVPPDTNPGCSTDIQLGVGAA